eukprot:TRINITY_DN5905_c0_g2_i1.p1 TRINITY_DN5905_c0_g2~~TRINITY_DN5905_c0_g2_i1.p1  ORF type:complete len:130 (-),score=5.38 TRINITY_DN5905_c0_g2_i1:83-472(-)
MAASRCACRLSAILDGTNVGTWEWNIQTSKVIFNERWANIIGYELAELQPVNFETWIRFGHPEDMQTSLMEVGIKSKKIAERRIDRKEYCIEAVSYTHLTLPTICSVQISVVAVSLKKKNIKHFTDGLI